MKIECIKPEILWLIPILGVVFIGSIRFFRYQEPKFQKKIMALRFLIVVCLILAVSGLHIRLKSEQMSTVFLVDVSDSMKQYQQEEEKFLREALQKMPKKNQAGIVVFGQDALVEQFITEKKIFDDITTTPLTTATDFEKAIATGISMFPEDSGKRLVLLTDGYDNAGNLSSMEPAFTAQQIEMKVFFYDQALKEEVYVKDLSVPEKIRQGEKFKIMVTISSTLETTADLNLYAGREWRKTESVILHKGENQFVFHDTQTEGGIKTYRVEVKAKQDTSQLNNEYSAYTDVELPAKILLIEGTSGNGKAMKQLLFNASYQYEVLQPDQAPKTMQELTAYQTILLNNVFADDFNKGFLQNIESYVKDYAGGVIAIGGDNSFALGGYEDTVLEQILPVQMHLKGEKEIPKIAMTMVIDHSGSMLDGNKVTLLDLAKQAAINAISSLRGTDEIGVLAFDDRYQWAVPIQQLKDRTQVEDAIASIPAGGGTSIYPALEEAIKELEKSDAQLKHVILLTDGQDGYHEYGELVERAKKSKITISTVAAGKGADQWTLRVLAEQGNGRYYYTDANSNLPRIFAKEVYLSMKDYLVQEEFTPVITSSHSILRGVVEAGMPTLLGYVGSSPKSNATVLLESEREDPILTVWQYGLGKTVAWNSDATNQWTVHYAGWDKYFMLWKQIIDYTISDMSSKNDFVHVETNGNEVNVSYTTNDYGNGTKVTMFCTDEEGNQKEIRMKAVEPGTYKGTYLLEQAGVTSINIRNEKNGTLINSMNTAAIMQYSKEYRFDGTKENLENFMEQSNGKRITKPEEVFTKYEGMVKADFELFRPLVLISMGLFLMDIAYRRFHIRANTISEPVVQKKEKGGEKGSKDRKFQMKVGKDTKSGKNTEKENVLLDTEKLLKKKDQRNGS